jgi:hypothetical protein
MQHRQHSAASPRPQKAKPTLTMLHLPHYRVKQRHLEAYLSKVYRMEGWDFLLASGATPGLCVEYQVNPAIPPAGNFRHDADNIRRGHRSRNVPLILNVLCLDGYIPAGTYIIDTHPEPPPGQVYRALLMRTEDPSHPACVAFKRAHQHSRGFMQAAVQMEKAVREQKG